MSTLNPPPTKKLAPIEPPISEPHRPIIKIQSHYDHSASSRVYAKVFALDWTADIRVPHLTLGKITGRSHYPAGTEVVIPPASVPVFSLPLTVRGDHVNDELDIKRKLCTRAKNESDKNRVLVVSNSELVDPKHAVMYYNAPRGVFEVLCTSHKGIKVNNVSYFPWDGSVDLIDEQTLIYIGDTILTIHIPSSSSVFLDVHLATSQTFCIPSSLMGTRSFIDYARSDLKPPHPFPELIARTSVKVNLTLHSSFYHFQHYPPIPNANADDTLWYFDLTQGPIVPPISNTLVSMKEGSAREFRDEEWGIKRCAGGWRKGGTEVIEHVKFEEEEEAEVKEKLIRKRPKIIKVMDNRIKENVDLKTDLLHPQSCISMPPSLAPLSPPISDLALEPSRQLTIGKTDCSPKDLRDKKDAGMQTPVSPSISPIWLGDE
ncbi:hypothetical protein BC937DRAFT_91376 [Endogone sp. FLAS-F59071]|nr:hypothetical protein BC937DRAFT_91376 [Endogone sp. FLAS-F59071]|eukprot:RUS21816.1 hypothetical protein BC937DRAFT_91376 [Endogone sp. FLAS-F59071]